MMQYCIGTIVALRQCGGCVEVTVAGETPGTFIIDNACFGMIAANEGTDWIGRPVEYEEAHMRFLDHPADEAEYSDLSATCP
jgi:hypothetical protein